MISIDVNSYEGIVQLPTNIVNMKTGERLTVEMQPISNYKAVVVRRLPLEFSDWTMLHDLDLRLDVNAPRVTIHVWAIYILENLPSFSLDLMT